MKIKLNGDIQQYIWGVILDKALEDAPEWAGLVQSVRNRTITVTAANKYEFIAAFGWFSEIAEEEIEGLSLSGEELAANRTELACANKIIDRLYAWRPI